MIHLCRILLCVMFMPYSIGYAQDTTRYLYQRELQTDPATGKVLFEEVVPTDSLSRDELYNRAREWFVRRFKSAENVLQMDDRIAGKLAGRGWQDIEIESLQALWYFKLKFLVIVQFKDGRYKLTLTDIEYQAHPTPKDLNPSSIPCEDVIINNLYKKNGDPKHVPRQYKEQTIKTWKSISSDLREHLTRPRAGTEDW